jgi:hypothetical protein
MSTETFTVKFGAIARTIEYDEPQGRLLFTFDLSNANPKTVVLEHHSPKTLRGPRYNIAFDRTKQFLESRGYKVEIFGQ